jgi:hypothetical protein
MIDVRETIVGDGPTFMSFLDQSSPDLKNYNRPITQKNKVLWQRAYMKVRSNNRIKRMFAYLQSTQYEGKSELFKTRCDSLNPSFLVHQKLPKTKILNPSGKYYLCWLCIMALVLIYLGVIDPFISAFYDVLDTDLGMRGEIVIDFVFLTDLLINFNLAFTNEEGLLVYNRKEIAMNYLKGWFCMDFLSSIPLSLIGYYQGSHSKASGLIKLIRLRNVPKLVRIGKLMSMLKRFLMIEDVEYLLNKYNRLFRMIKVIISVCACIHIVACLFFLMAKLDNFGSDTWVSRYGLSTLVVADCYETSVYWAITTLTTIGYGDITPRLPLEKLLAMIWMIIGVYVVCFSVSSFSYFYLEIDLKNKVLDSQILIAEDFSTRVNIPSKLRYILKKTIRRMNFTSKHDLEFMLKGVPIELKKEIAVNAFNKAIGKFPFFDDKSDSFIIDVALRLEADCVDSQADIYLEKEPAYDIFFLTQGKVKISYGDTVFTVLSEGQIFGDTEMIYQIERAFGAKAAMNSKVLKLNRETLNMIKDNYPNEWESMRHITKVRAKNLVNILAEALTIKKLKEKGTLGQLTVHKYSEKVKKVAKFLFLKLSIFSKEARNKKLISELKASNEKLIRLHSLLFQLESLIPS